MQALLRNDSHHHRSWSRNFCQLLLSSLSLRTFGTWHSAWHIVGTQSKFVKWVLCPESWADERTTQKWRQTVCWTLSRLLPWKYLFTCRGQVLALTEAVWAEHAVQKSSAGGGQGCCRQEHDWRPSPDTGSAQSRHSVNAQWNRLCCSKANKLSFHSQGVAVL